MNSNSIELKMDSMKATKRLKLCVDLKYDCVGRLKELHKQKTVDKIEEQIEGSKECNQTNDPKNCENKGFDYKNNDFEFETQLKIEKGFLELRQSLSQLTDSTPDSDHYFQLIKRLSYRQIRLENKLKALEKELLFWQKKLRSDEHKVNQSLSQVKTDVWCRVCARRAVQPYQCCREGYYCSYTHFKGNKSHFMCCKLNENRQQFY